MSSTLEAYSQASRCFRSDYKTYTNDNHQRCYAVTCEGGVPSILDTRCTGDTISIEGASIACHNPCESMLHNCNFNGRWQAESCYCTVGKKGVYCD